VASRHSSSIRVGKLAVSGKENVGMVVMHVHQLQISKVALLLLLLAMRDAYKICTALELTGVVIRE
jgi:hypothetical protein